MAKNDYAKVVRYGDTNWKKWESVNSATTKLAKEQSMGQLGQLGQVVKRIVVTTMADHYDPNKPFVFTKLDIKDGFWRMAISNEAAWNFCYVLPSETPSDTINEWFHIAYNWVGPSPPRVSVQVQKRQQEI